MTGRYSGGLDVLHVQRVLLDVRTYKVLLRRDKMDYKVKTIIMTLRSSVSLL